MKSSVAAMSALAGRALAQVTSSFSSPNLDSVTAGMTYPLAWTVGDGTPVSIFLGNTTANTAVFENMAAATGMFNWTVCAPTGWVAGPYALGLLQSGAVDFTPLITLNIPAGSVPCNAAIASAPMTMPPATGTPMPNSNMTVDPAAASMTPPPVVTVYVYDPDCTCHKASTLPGSAVTAAPGLNGTSYTWYETECGCTKTGMATAPTSVMGSNNYTAPTGGNVPVAPSAAAPVAPATSSFMTQTKNGANQLGGSAMAIVGVIVAAMCA